MNSSLKSRSARRSILGGVFVAALVLGGVAPPALADTVVVATPGGADITVSAALGSVTMSATFSSIEVAGDSTFQSFPVANEYPEGSGITGAGDLVYFIDTSATLAVGSTITTCLEFDPAEIGNVAVRLYVQNPISGLLIDGTTSNPTPDSACILENVADKANSYLPVFTAVPIVPQPLPIFTNEYELSVEPDVGPINLEDEGLIDGDFPILKVRFSNLSDSAILISFGIDMRLEGVADRFWLDDTWGGVSAFGSYFARSIEPGNQLAWDVPDWPGRDYSFYLLESGDQSDFGQLLGTYETTGRFVSFDFSSLALVDGSFTLGSEAVVSGTGSTPEVFPGVTATVTSSGLTPGDELALWLAPGLDYFWFYFTGAVLPVDAVNVGSGVVAPDGSLSATFEVPSNTPLGSYQLMVGDPADRFWPAGSYSSFQVTLPSSSGSVTAPAGQTVTVDLGATDVSFSTGSNELGTVSAALSTTGPILDGFIFTSNPQLYYHLSSTVDPTSPVLVCITYDPLMLTGEVPYLYHYANGQWQNITTTRTAGYVCGTTTSFSPFTLGYPVEGQPVNKDGCKDGGWELSALPVFSNQGTCVSYFVAAVKK